MKVLARRGRDFDDRALEFAAAVGSLRLAKRDLEKLLNGALNSTQARLPSLLGLLVMAKQATRLIGDRHLQAGERRPASSTANRLELTTFCR